MEVNNKIPKSLALVSQKPLLEWIIENLIKQGFERIILGTGHKSDQIEEYIYNKWDKNCFISKESFPLGTAGAIKNAYNFFKSKNILVLNGDSYIKYNYQNLVNFNTKNNYDLSILLKLETIGQDYGNVTISNKNKILKFQEKYKKSRLVNSGVYCIKRKLINTIKPNRFFSLEKDMIPIWIKEKSIYGLVVNEPFIDIGVPKRYYKAKI